MNKLLLVVVSVFFLVSACGSRNNEEEEHSTPAQKNMDNCWTKPIPSKDPVTIKVWLDPNKYLSEARVLSGLNTYWSKLGLHVVKASSPKTANFGLVYVSTKCRIVMDVGRVQYNEWADLDSIMVDYTCFSKIPNYLDKLPSALSSALGMLMGIEPYPSFCSEGGVMADGVMQMTFKSIPVRLSEGDKKSFSHRRYFFKDTVYETVCKEKEEEWEKGVYTPAAYEKKVHRFWTAPSINNLPVGDYLNKYFALFGQSFVQVSDPDKADFFLYDWGEQYNDCSPTAIAYMEDSEVFFKYGECVGSGDNTLQDATVVVHEVAHLFGMQHIPEWCGNAIMDPIVNAGPGFTPLDVKDWVYRLPNPLETQVLKVEKSGMKLGFIPLSHLK